MNLSTFLFNFEVTKLVKSLFGEFAMASLNLINSNKGPEWNSMESFPPVDVKLQSPCCFCGCKDMFSVFGEAKP